MGNIFTGGYGKQTNSFTTKQPEQYLQPPSYEIATDESKFDTRAVQKQIKTIDPVLVRKQAILLEKKRVLAENYTIRFRESNDHILQKHLNIAHHTGKSSFGIPLQEPHDLDEWEKWLKECSDKLTDEGFSGRIVLKPFWHMVTLDLHVNPGKSGVVFKKK